MGKTRIYVDFNEMVTENIVLLSKEDTKIDSDGNLITFYEGMPIIVGCDDVADDETSDNLIAEGIAIQYDLSDIPSWAHVKWCCKINEKGILHISDLIPKYKDDNSGIEILKTIDINEAEPILNQLLEWIQDMNWPVAREVFDLLPRFHNKLIPHIKAVFDSNDAIWKSHVLWLLKDFPAETVAHFSPDIRRIAEYPTAGEIEEETNLYAIDVIEKFNL